MREGLSSRYLVTPVGADDIGSVLSSMGEGFQWSLIDPSSLARGRGLDGCEVLFINCCSASVDIATVVAKFVKQGGTAYISCCAVDILEAAFPGLLTTSDNADLVYGDTHATVVDAGLRELLGKTGLNVTLGGWPPTRQTSRFDGRVLLTGLPEVSFYGEIDDDLYRDDVPYPLLLTFSHQRGYVIYTAFHNHEQTSADEKKLLRYLVLRPVLAKAAGAAAQVVAGERCTPGREIMATVNRGQRSTPYVYDAAGNEDLFYILSWVDSGQLRMVVTDPSGKVRYDSRGSTTLRFEAPGQAGRWTCVVEAVSVPHDNFPYVLTLASRKRSGTQMRGGSLPPVPPPSGGGLWSCYIVIDCSGRASDVGPAIGQGLSAFIRGLGGLRTAAVTPAVSFVESREGSVKVAAPTVVTALAPVNLTCKGKEALAPALRALLPVLKQPPGQYRGKPFVVTLLAAEPGDSFQGDAGQLKQLAGQGKANTVAIGLGREVTDATLRTVGVIALRVADPTARNCTACFQWLVQVAGAAVGALSRQPGKAVTLPPLPQGTAHVE